MTACPKEPSDQRSRTELQEEHVDTESGHIMLARLVAALRPCHLTLEDLAMPLGLLSRLFGRHRTAAPCHRNLRNKAAERTRRHFLEHLESRDLLAITQLTTDA